METQKKLQFLFGSKIMLPTNAINAVNVAAISNMGLW